MLLPFVQVVIFLVYYVWNDELFVLELIPSKHSIHNSMRRIQFLFKHTCCSEVLLSDFEVFCAPYIPRVKFNDEHFSKRICLPQM